MFGAQRATDGEWRPMLWHPELRGPALGLPDTMPPRQMELSEEEPQPLL